MLSEGTILNHRYEVQSVLGEGGMGAVYLATDQDLGGATVAIKEMVVTVRQPEQRTRALEQFRQEARLLASLSHPSLVRVSDYFEAPDHAYLVMDYVDGQTLATVAASRDVPLHEVVEWADQVAQILEYLHEQDPAVLFSDLKPSNVMLDGRNQVRLIDFGIARTLEVGQRTRPLLRNAGTAQYAPVEQFRGRDTDTRSDIYSLGATTFHLLTGELPPIAIDVLSGEVPPANPRAWHPGIPPMLEAVVLKAMALHKEDRYQDVREMRIDLARIPPYELQTCARRPGFRSWGPDTPPPTPGFQTPTTPATDRNSASESRTTAGPSPGARFQTPTTPSTDGSPASEWRTPTWPSPGARFQTPTTPATDGSSASESRTPTRPPPTPGFQTPTTPSMDGNSASGSPTPTCPPPEGPTPGGFHSAQAPPRGPLPVPWKRGPGATAAAVGISIAAGLALLLGNIGPTRKTAVATPSPPPTVVAEAPRPPVPPPSAKPSPTIASESVFLQIDSRPKGARVVVDESMHQDGTDPLTTPVRVALKPGYHQVEVSASGYEPFHTRIRLQKGQLRSIHARLMPKITRGRPGLLDSGP